MDNYKMLSVGDLIRYGRWKHSRIVSIYRSQNAVFANLELVSGFIKQVSAYHLIKTMGF